MIRKQKIKAWELRAGHTVHRINGERWVLTAFETGRHAYRGTVKSAVKRRGLRGLKVYVRFHGNPREYALAADAEVTVERTTS